MKNHERMENSVCFHSKSSKDNIHYIFFFFLKKGLKMF